MFGVNGKRKREQEGKTRLTSVHRGFCSLGKYFGKDGRGFVGVAGEAEEVGTAPAPDFARGCIGEVVFGGRRILTRLAGKPGVSRWQEPSRGQGLLGTAKGWRHVQRSLELFPLYEQLNLFSSYWMPGAEIKVSRSIVRQSLPTEYRSPF